MILISPTTTERRIRTVAITAGAFVLGAWFLYDGYVGYPAKNLSKAAAALNPAPENLPPLNDLISRSVAEALIEELKDAGGVAGIRC